MRLVRTGRARPRPLHPGRDRRPSDARAADPGRRARHHLERGLPSRAPAGAHPGRRRRLHRGRVRRHLRRPRLRDDAAPSRRQAPARLRRGRARTRSREAYRRRGIDLLLERPSTRLERAGEAIAATLSDGVDAASSTRCWSRRPAAEHRRLGLETAGVARRRRRRRSRSTATRRPASLDLRGRRRHRTGST